MKLLDLLDRCFADFKILGHDRAYTFRWLNATFFISKSTYNRMESFSRLWFAFKRFKQTALPYTETADMSKKIIDYFSDSVGGGSKPGLPKDSPLSTDF